MTSRIDRAKTRLEQLGLDAFLVSSLTNIRYLFGFTGSNAIALITSGLCFLVTDSRYREQAARQVDGAEVLIAKRDLLLELKKRNVLKTGARLAIEVQHLNVKDFNHLKKLLPEVKIIASERIVENIASVKDADEVESIKQAAAICCKVISEIYALIEPGVLELEVSAELSYRTKMHGSETDPFEPIVASGLRSALPHGVSSKKPIEAGDLIVLDFGAVVNGYAADFTRTVVVGDPTVRQQELGRAVQKALLVSAQQARPGLSGKELDKIARDCLQQAGLGSAFLHSLGHGLGLEVHELPRISQHSQDKLQAGNVITLEPGVYLSDVGGIRIEDDFLVTNHGVENLTPFPREMVGVG